MIQNAACPWLPPVENPLGPEVTRRHGKDRGEAFYQDALRYSQSMWVQGKPAQALLQLNKAWMSDLTDDEVLEKFPPPYQAMICSDPFQKPVTSPSTAPPAWT